MPAPVRERSVSAAEQTLAREYGELRGPTLASVRARLSGQRLHVDDADLEACYNQAWHGLYERLLTGEEVENHTGFLVLVTYRRAIDEVRRLRPDEQADGAGAEAAVEDVDLAARLDDRRRVLGMMEGMRERLSERERQAAALCYLHGYTRPEAAQALGLAPKRMEKLMDGISRKVGGLAQEIDDGGWCETRASLMKAYAFGVLDPDGERHALARAHLHECSACRRYVRGLRGMGAVVPPVLLPLGLLAAVGAGAAGAAGGSAAAGSTGGGGGGAAAGGGMTAGWGVAAAAVAVVAAAIGGFALVSSKGGSPRTVAPPPPPTAASAPSRAAPKPKAKPAAAKPRTKQAAATPAAGATPTPTPSPVPAAQTTPAAVPAQPGAAPKAPAAAPTTDGEQEFGFER